LKEDFGGLRQSSLDLKEAVASSFEELEKIVCDKVRNFNFPTENIQNMLSLYRLAIP
jgi:hypothetical protein